MTAVILLTLAAVLLFFGYAGIRETVPEELSEETAASIKHAVQQSALQCYAVEGVYPPDIEYLRENYGLRINTDAYVVAYEAYAENQMPNVKVVKKKQ